MTLVFLCAGRCTRRGLLLADTHLCDGQVKSDKERLQPWRIPLRHD